MRSSSTVIPQDLPGGMTSKQHAWQDLGRWLQHKVAEEPELYIVKPSRYTIEAWGLPFLQWLGPLKGKTVLDIGCGLGYFSTYAAMGGAKVFAVDLQLEMLRVARSIAAINGARCQFQRANVSRLPFASNSFDVVVGMDILHHLSKPDLITALREVHRILRRDGMAILAEPIENSKIFNFIQNLFPAGQKHSGYYRPSRLATRAWARYVASMDGRDITTRELVRAGAPFKLVLLESFGLLNRLDRFVKDKRLIALLNLFDHYVFKCCPFLKRFSRGVLVKYQK